MRWHTGGSNTPTDFRFFAGQAFGIEVQAHVIEDIIEYLVQPGSSHANARIGSPPVDGPTPPVTKLLIDPPDQFGAASTTRTRFTCIRLSQWDTLHEFARLMGP